MMAPGIFLKLLRTEFPENVIHLCAIHTDSRLPEKYILAKDGKQWFIGPDNGFLPIGLTEEATYYKLPELPYGKDPMFHCFVPVLQTLMENHFSTESFEAEEKPRKYLFPTPTVTGNVWRLMVVYNDAEGNAYLNMDKSEFEKFTSNRSFRIRLGLKDNIEQISASYRDVQEGNKLALFGYGNLLQIAIHCGSAEQYLGLKYGTMVMLEISESSILNSA